MSSFWSRFVEGVGARETSPSPEIPPAPPSDRRGFPSTFRPAAPDDGPARPLLFDPALRQFPRAFRPGDPKFPTVAEAEWWVRLRRMATDHVLRRVAESPAGENLILRGSRTMRAWFGPEAREPGDLDWVVDPPTLTPNSPRSAEMLRQLADAALDSPNPEGVEFVREEVASEDIWTYERAPGRRIVFPWQAPGMPRGAVQVDIVFGQTLADPARWEAIPAEDGGCVPVRVATPAQSLAWKLLWIQTDLQAQGKDLYDAALLAARYPLPLDILQSTFASDPEGAREIPRSVEDFTRDWHIDWATFRAEYPRADPDEAPWRRRLVEALGPTFEGRAGAGEDPGRAPAWLTPTVVELARAIADARDWEGLPILADALEEAGCDREDLLLHCRARGPHSRGCRAVDLVLGEFRD